MNLAPSFQRRFIGISLFVFLLLTVSFASAVQNPPDGGCFIYPMPASGNTAWAVYIMPSSGTAQIGVFNEKGDLVSSIQAWNDVGLQKTAVDLTHYRRGIYICHVVLTLDSGLTLNLKLFKFMVIR